MKKSKILAILLAAALLIVAALPLTALAAGENATLILNPPDSLVLDKDNFTAYKLFDVSISGTAPNKNYAYTPTAALNVFLADPAIRTAFCNDPTNTLSAAEAAANFKAYLEGTPDMDLVNRALTTAPIYPTACTFEAEQDGKGVKFTGLDYGYYLVIGTANVSNGGGTKEVVTYSNLLTVENKTETVDIKADAPEINKKVWQHPDAPYNNSKSTVPDPADAGWGNWADVNIGDTVYFQLTSKVPEMTGYKSYAFTVHDYMSPGLTFDPSSVKVVIGGSAIALVNTDEKYYTVSNSVTITGGDERDPAEEYKGGEYIKITFDPDEFRKFEANANIVITYSAVLNEDAVIGNPGNPNKVWLEYSNDPYSTKIGVPGTTNDTPEDEVIVYTFDLEIYKHTGKITGEHTPLPGAEFELKTGERTVYVVPYTEGGYNYRVATPQDIYDAIQTSVLVSGADGLIRIKGLDAGTYALQETKAPEGYNLLPGWITDIVIEKDDSLSGYSVTLEGTPAQCINVENNSGPVLPGTGGIGTTIFYIVSAILTAGLVAFFVIRRKRNILKVN